MGTGGAREVVLQRHGWCEESSGVFEALHGEEWCEEGAVDSCLLMGTDGAKRAVRSGFWEALRSTGFVSLLMRRRRGSSAI